MERPENSVSGQTRRGSQLSDEADSIRVEQSKGSASGRRNVRTESACDECRFRKIKCIADGPVCLPCRRRDGNAVACRWSRRRGRGPARRKTVPADAHAQGTAVEPARHSPPGPLHTSRTIERLPNNVSITSPTEDESGPVNAMMGLVGNDETQNPADTSGSSIASFTRHIQKLLSLPTPNQNKSHSRQEWLHGRPSSLATVTTKQQDYVLPLRLKADRLLETYWDLVDSTYPYVDRDDFTRYYRSLWAGEDLGSDLPVFLCLMNAMLAWASLVDPMQALQDRVTSAQVFYQRACSLDLQQAQSRSLLTVQCFLILGHCAFSRQACWTFVGMATRAAQSLGLDLPVTSAQVSDPQRRSLLRRTWYGCVLIDRTLSMIYGRPTQIPASAAFRVPRPIAHADESPCTCGQTNSLPSEQNTSRADSHFLIAAIELFDVMDEFKLAVRQSTDGERELANESGPHASPLGGAVQAVNAILHAESALYLWEHSLPRCMQWRTPQAHPIHARQCNHLWVRSQHFRVFMFQPALLRLCSYSGRKRQGSADGHDGEEVEKTFLYHVLFRGAVSCVEAAVALIEFFESMSAGRTPGDLDRILPPWFRRTYYIHSAAWVVIAAILHLDIVQLLPKDRLSTAYRAAIVHLESFSSVDPSISRYVAALRSAAMEDNSEGRRVVPGETQPEDNTAGILDLTNLFAATFGSDYDDPLDFANGLFTSVDEEPAPLEWFQQNWIESLWGNGMS